ncbi:MAG: DNA-binding protein [Moraxellaceae bacterium]|nr:MAG: DNA-binding protein [Moraxellaceae bacterium]
MQAQALKTVFLAWQAPDRNWFPVGRLVHDVANMRYEFDYTNGALLAQQQAGFTPLIAFPDFNQHYCATELFPLFANRVLARSRKEFAEYLNSLDLDPNHLDLLDVLAVSGGERQTDSFEVFPKMEKTIDGNFKCRFFLHGLRHAHPVGAERAAQLAVGEALQILIEVNNPKSQTAICLQSSDYLPLGWAPRYLVADLLRAMAAGPHLEAKLVKANPDNVPLNRRYLIEMQGRLPTDFEPMSGEQFQIIGH